MVLKEINLPEIALANGMDPFQIQICYASESEITFLDVRLLPGICIADLLEVPAIREKFPVLNGEDCKFGIFGKLKTPETVLQANDRLEIYRPLDFDPMEARRRRAGKRKSRKM